MIPIAFFDISGDQAFAGWMYAAPRIGEVLYFTGWKPARWRVRDVNHVMMRDDSRGSGHRESMINVIVDPVIDDDR